MDPANHSHPNANAPLPSAATPSAPKTSLPPAIQTQLSTMEDKVEYYSLFLLAIALAHLSRWANVAVFSTGSAVDELAGKSPIPAELWFSFALGILFVLLFVWSFRQRALAMYVGLIIHIPTLLVTGFIALAAREAVGQVPLHLLWRFAWFLSIASAVGLFEGVRTSYRYTQLLRAHEKP